MCNKPPLVLQTGGGFVLLWDQDQQGPDRHKDERDIQANGHAQQQREGPAEAESCEFALHDYFTFGSGFFTKL
jgi:hypothetical protein